jgi:glycosyltransferase involved in cell wall biosynthesis
MSEIRDIRHDSAMLKRLEQIVSQSPPDLIWERNSRLSTATMTVAKKLNVPYVIEWLDHLIPYSISLYHNRAVKVEKLKNRNADFIIVVSQTLKENLAKEGIEPAKILVCYNAVNPDEFAPNPGYRSEYRQNLGIKDEDVLIGYLGSFAFYHDTARLVFAADILRKQQVPVKVKFLMVGAGKEYDQTYTLAARLGLLDSLIIFKPWIPSEDVPKVLPALDIAVLPGGIDIMWPIKIPEYMATELPAVIPKYDCNREVITDNKTGLLFEPKNEKSLAEKLLTLIGDKQLRITIGKNARQEVLDRFTWEKTWGKTLQQILSKTKK